MRIERNKYFLKWKKNSNWINKKNRNNVDVVMLFVSFSF